LPIFVIVLLLVIIINEKDLPNATTILYSVCMSGSWRNLFSNNVY